MTFELVYHNARKQVKNLNAAQMVSNYELSVILVKLYAGYITFEDVFEHSYRFSFFGIPDLDGALSCDVELESDMRKFGY